MTALDAAFDNALRHLSDCRAAYEDDPADPDRIAALGRARIRLEDARTAMDSERRRLGLELRGRTVASGSASKIEGDALKLWQTINGPS